MLAEPVDDVAGGAAAIGAVGLGALVELRERAFEQARGHADQRDGPHPEHRAGTAQSDGDGDTGDVAAAHASADADEKGLPGCDVSLGTITRIGEQDPKHPPEILELHQPGEQSEEQAQNDEKRNQ